MNAFIEGLSTGGYLTLKAMLLFGFFYGSLNAIHYRRIRKDVENMNEDKKEQTSKDKLMK